MVEERCWQGAGFPVTYETVRQWGKKFGKAFCADQTSASARRLRGDKWHMDEGRRLDRRGDFTWLWRAVDQANGFVLDVLVQRPKKDARAAQRLLKSLYRHPATAPAARG